MPKELEPEKYNPDENLRIFSTNNLVMWLIVALIAHAVIIGGTSVGYLVNKFTGAEEGKQEEAAAAEEAGDTDEAAEGAESEDQETPDDEGAGEGEAATVEKPDSEKTQEELMEDRQDTDVVRETQEAAAPEDIPDDPEEVPFSIEDTNP